MTGVRLGHATSLGPRGGHGRRCRRCGPPGSQCPNAFGTIYLCIGTLHIMVANIRANIMPDMTICEEARRSAALVAGDCVKTCLLSLLTLCIITVISRHSCQDFCPMQGLTVTRCNQVPTDLRSMRIHLPRFWGCGWATAQVTKARGHGEGAAGDARTRVGLQMCCALTLKTSKVPRRWLEVCLGLSPAMEIPCRNLKTGYPKHNRRYKPSYL